MIVEAAVVGAGGMEVDARAAEITNFSEEQGALGAPSADAVKVLVEEALGSDARSVSVDLSMGRAEVIIVTTQWSRICGVNGGRLRRLEDLVTARWPSLKDALGIFGESPAPAAQSGRKAKKEKR